VSDKRCVEFCFDMLGEKNKLFICILAGREKGKRDEGVLKRRAVGE